MKTLKAFFSVLIVIFTFTSCDVEPLDSAIDISTGGGSGTSVGIFTAKVNGVNFVAEPEAIIANYSISSLGNELNIVGLNTLGESVSIQLLNPSLGTFEASYNLSDLNLLQYFDATMGINGTFLSYNQITETSIGTVTITNFDTVGNKVSGTFSFTGYNPSDSSTRQITNGVFTNISFENTVD